MPDPADIAWHPTLTGDIAGAVPDLMDGTNTLVENHLAANRDYADAALAGAQAALIQLANASLPHNLPEPPDVPTIITSATLGGGLSGSSIPFLGALDIQDVAEFVADAIAIPDISEAPEYTPVITGLSIPEAPVFAAPARPTAPGLTLDFDVPDAPAADYGLAPSLLDLNLPTYTAPSIPVFGDEAPEFDTLPPSPFVQWVGPEYTSPVKTAIATVLATLLAGGTGLTADVELALWERARGRELSAVQKVVDEATNQWAVRGFSHPPGQLNQQVLAAQEEAQLKANSLSRDIAIEQAKLEQKNREFGVEKGVMYEQVFVGLYGQIVDRNFQIAKFNVETQIQIYNMQIAAFNVAQAIFKQKGERYRLLLEAAFANLKAFEALVNAEKAKSDFNIALVQAFDSKVKAFGAQVEAYKAVVMTATARAELERNKVELFKAQIEGQVAEINVQRGAFEAYSARVAGESAKAGLEESNAKVFGARVQAFATQSELGFKRAEVQMQSNKLKLEYSIGNLQRVTSFQGQQLTAIQAKLAAYQASVARSVAEFGATSSIKHMENTTHIELARLSLGKYEVLQKQWATRSAEIIQYGQIHAENLRAVAQVASNLASGAMAGTHVSAGVSAAANSSQTRSDQKSEHLGFNQGVNDSSSYNININRKGADVA